MDFYNKENDTRRHMFSRQIHLAAAHAGSVGALGPCAQGCGPHARRAQAQSER